MKRSEIYLAATTLIESGSEYGCCDAIARIQVGSPHKYSSASTEFADLFSPEHMTYAYWGDQWGDYDENRQCRVLALLFMSAIAQWEETHK